MGVSVVNGLSKWCEVEVCSKLIAPEGRVYSQRYERGVPVTEVEDIGAGSTTGTKTTFKPDDEIFETVEYNRK